MDANENDEVVQVGPIRVWYDRKIGITITEFEPGTDLTIEQTKPFTDAVIKVTGGTPRPLLIDFKNMKSQTKENRDYYAKDPAHSATLTAAALVVNSVLTRMIANFFLGMNKSVKPVRLFDDRESAIKWLQSLPPPKN